MCTYVSGCAHSGLQAWTSMPKVYQCAGVKLRSSYLPENRPSPPPPNSVYIYQVPVSGGRLSCVVSLVVLVQILSLCLKDFC